MLFPGMKRFWFAVLLTGMLTAAGTDQEANVFFSQGRAREKAASFRRAAARYMDAHFMADSSVLRGNALIAAARAWRKAKLYGEEFDCLQRLIQEHLNQIDFTRIVKRQYEIGDLYFEGHRDLVADWLPFIKKADRTMEIYEAALKNAPCFERAGETRLRLARMYIDGQKCDDAIRHLREIPKLHPGTKAAQYAMLELCSLLLQMSERGDGDGSYGRQALEACDRYLAAFPKTSEVPWVVRTRQKVRNLLAAHLHAVGKFYYRSGRPELAERYLADVVKNYANTKQAAASETLLAKIDREFDLPPGGKRRYRDKREILQRKPLPEEAQPVMITPEESSRRWLLPVRNLRRSPALNANEITPAARNEFRKQFHCGENAAK